MKRRHVVLLHCSVWMLLLLFAAQSYSQADYTDNQTNQFYVIIGNVKGCKHIDWQDRTPIKGETLPDDGSGKNTRRVRIPMLFQYQALVFGNHNLFKITDGVATNVTGEKKVVLMRDKTGRMNGTEEYWRKGCERIVSCKERMLFRGAPRDFPEGLLEEYDLKDCLILEAIPGSQGLPENTYSRIFNLELKKYGIVLPERINPDTANTNPVATQADTQKHE